MAWFDRLSGAAGAVVTLAFLLIAHPAMAALEMGRLDGVWLTEEGAAITIGECEIGRCGRITTIAIPADIYAKHQNEIDGIGLQLPDARNKDESLRDRPILGVQIVGIQNKRKRGGFAANLYNPQDGNTYSGFIEFIDDDTVRLSGCILFDLLCQSSDWTRLSEEAAEAMAPVVVISDPPADDS